LALRFCVFRAFCAIRASLLQEPEVCFAESEENTPKRAESGLQGWIDCYEKSALKAHLFCGGVNNPREINGNPKLQEAFELGKNV
jgi:hypothetical protein